MQHAPRILIVEDQYLVAIDCEHSLREGGFECVGLAGNSAAALELAVRERPDLVLMDVRIGGRRDGVDVAIELYERLGLRCLFTSGHADATVHARAERARPLGWLDKPYSSEALIEAVHRALKTAQGERSSEAPSARVRNDAQRAMPGHMAFN